MKKLDKEVKAVVMLLVIMFLSVFPFMAGLYGKSGVVNYAEEGAVPIHYDIGIEVIIAPVLLFLFIVGFTVVLLVLAKKPIKDLSK